MILKFQPTKDRVLIDPISGVIGHVGTIAIPEAHQDKAPSEGVVAAIGPKVDLMKVGERVLFPRYEGEQVKIGVKTFRLFRQNDVLATVD